MRRALSAVLVLVLLAGILLGAVPAHAASAKDSTRAIGIVFDNSGSMYVGSEDGRKAWCRATYATEAFAAMMNQNDIMQVYPMNPISVGGKTYTYEDPLVISQSNASTIRQIFTTKPGDTHIETITAACQGLMNTTADEKWLVVLTDGDEFYRDGRALGKGRGTISALEEDLSACNAQVNVMYLGMGSQSAMPNEVTGNYFYHAKKTTNSAEVLSALSEMCNTIFGRDSLPNVGKSVPFDVSMSKLILFVQGEGIKNVKLGDKTPASVIEMRYSTQGGGGDYAKSFLVDESLQGVMAIYTDLDAGEYPLSYEGTASSVDCYYEPDVDLVTEFVDASGKPVDPAAELLAGEYTLRYSLVDKYGQAATSKLLGDVDYELSYAINGEEKTDKSGKPGELKLELGPNDQLDAQIKVTYLDGYTIVRDAEDMGWPAEGLLFLPPPAGMLEAKLSGGASEYKIGGLPEQEAFRVEFTYDGKKLSGDELDRLEQLQAVVEGGNVGAKVGRDDRGVYANLDYYGSPAETDCGDFVLRVSGVYRNEDGLLTNVAADTAIFSLQDNSRQLEMDVVVPQDYHQITQLDKSEPILAKLSWSGDPLTAEELDSINFTYECDSCSFVAEPDYENSGYTLRFDQDNPPQIGTHKVKIRAEGVNESGKQTVAEKKLNQEVGVIPPWLRLALPVLLLILLALIIWLILNQKVLPKAVYVKEMEFSVDGETIDVKRSPQFDGAGKSKGYIKIYSPKAGTDPMAEQAIFLTVSAVSPRRVPSKQRKAKVTQAKLKGPQSVIYWKLKTHAYEPDPEKPGDFIHNVTGTPGFKEVDIGPTTDVEIQAQTDSSSVIFRCKIAFK